MPEQIKIKPEILKWVRESLNYSLPSFAKKIDLEPQRYEEIEKGKKFLTINQLFKISRKTNIPISYFYLETVPTIHEPIKEMRRFYDKSYLFSEDSPDLIQQIRLAYEKRKMALEFYSLLGKDIPELNLKVKLTDNPERVGKSLRDLLNVSIKEQFSWSDEYFAFNKWRFALEQKGILVFQIKKVDLAEMRGCALLQTPLSIIGINSKDFISAKIFTLFHELCHILLNDSVLENIDYFANDLTEKKEQFCNKVAVAILTPENMVKSEFNSKNLQGELEIKDLNLLAKQFKVSNKMMLIRIKDLGLISTSNFSALLSLINSFKVKTGKGGDYYKSKITEFGTLLPVLAFQSYDNEKFTLGELSSLFKMKVKNVDEFRNELMKKLL